MRNITSSCMALKSALRSVPCQVQPVLRFESLSLRPFSSSPLPLARNPGSIFGWNIFGKIKKPFLQKQEGTSEEATPAKIEPNEAKAAEWVPVDDKFSSSLEAPPKNVALSKENITQIFYEQIRANHPDAKEGSSDEELLSLSLEDPKIKLKVLPLLEEALNQASSSKKYSYPNRNLNNSQTVKDVFAYYALEEDRVGAFAGYPLEQFFRKLKEASASEPSAALPPNLVFKPHVPKPRKQRDVIPGCKHVPSKKKTSMPKKGGERRLPLKHLRNHL